MKLKFKNAKAMMPKIQTELRKKIIEFMQTDCGYTKEEAKEWSRVDIKIKHDSSSYGDYTGIYFEVGAELGYEDMSQLEEKLNPIVQKIDSDAYFEPYDPGITTCYIWYEDSEIESCDKIPIETTSEINGSEKGLWSVYYYEDPPSTGQRFQTQDEAYEYRDEMGEDYEATFMPGEQFAETSDDDFWLADLPKDDPDYNKYHDEYVKEKEEWERQHNKHITSAEYPDYGGAFDIDPHMFFTKEECMEFAQAVEDIVNADPDIEAQYVRYYDVYIVDYNRIVVDMEDSNGYEFSGQAKIDMRRIHSPLQDLINKYAQYVADQIIEDAKSTYEYVDSATNSGNVSEKSEACKECNNINSAGAIPYGDPEDMADRYYDDISDVEDADDVSGETTIYFQDFITIDKDGSWEWDEDKQAESLYVNDDDNQIWVDEETGTVLLMDDGAAAELLDDIMSDSLYLRLSNVPGEYKISGSVTVPYTIKNLAGSYIDGEFMYIEDSGDVDFDISRCKVNKFIAKHVK